MHFKPAKYGCVKSDIALLLYLTENLKTDIKSSRNNFTILV